MASTGEYGSEYPFNLDINAGNSIGFGEFVLAIGDANQLILRTGEPQSTIGGGSRSSSATAYIHPSLSRPNLDVVINTTVTKLKKSGKVDGKIAFQTVEMAATRTCKVLTTEKVPTLTVLFLIAKKYTVRAKREVILAAGAVGTPQILMLSGIGDGKALKALDIPTHINNPEVGANLADHPLTYNYWQVNSSNPVTADDVLFHDTVALADALAQWVANKTGILAHPLPDALGFLRFPESSTLFANSSDPSHGKGRYLQLSELLSYNCYLGPHCGHFEAILLVSAKSGRYDTRLVLPLSQRIALFCSRRRTPSRVRELSHCCHWYNFDIFPYVCPC